MRVILASLMVSSYENIFSGSSPSPRTAKEVICLVLWTRKKRVCLVLIHIYTVFSLFISTWDWSRWPVKVGELKLYQGKVAPVLQQSQEFLLGFSGLCRYHQSCPSPMQSWTAAQLFLESAVQAGIPVLPWRAWHHSHEVGLGRLVPIPGGCRLDPPHKGGWDQGRHLPQHHPAAHSGLHWLTPHGRVSRDAELGLSLCWSISERLA